MLQGLEAEGRNVDHRHGTEERAPKLHLLLIKAWPEETGQTYIEFSGLTGYDATSTKCILDAPKGYCKPRSNEILAVTACTQLVQGDLGLPEYAEKYKEVTAACEFEAAYDKCLQKAILLRLRNKKHK